MSKRFKFIGISELVLEHEQGALQSKHVATNVRLELSKNLDRKRYLKGDLPTKEALKPFTLAFVHGLIANIHSGHQKGWWDSAAHLRFIIDELQKGFVDAGAHVFNSTMDAYTEDEGKKE